MVAEVAVAAWSTAAARPSTPAASEAAVPFSVPDQLSAPDRPSMAAAFATEACAPGAIVMAVMVTAAIAMEAIASPTGTIFTGTSMRRIIMMITPITVTAAGSSGPITARAVSAIGITAGTTTTGTVTDFRFGFTARPYRDG